MFMHINLFKSNLHLQNFVISASHPIKLLKNFLNTELKSFWLTLCLSLFLTFIAIVEYRCLTYNKMYKCNEFIVGA